MQQNDLYDVIVVGASAEGLAALDGIRTRAANCKTLLISKDASARSGSYEGTVVYTSYLRGFIGVTTQDKETFWCKSLIIATGSKPKQRKCPIKCRGVSFNVSGLTKATKKLPAVVCGDGELAARYALEVSKYFKYVYLCTSGMELNCSRKTALKLNETANIAHLPNCSVVSGKANKQDELIEVTLDTYSAVKCSALFIAAERVPEVPGFDKKMLKLNEFGAIMTKPANNETTVVPNIYAVGECCDHNTKGAVKNVCDSIISKGNR